MNFRKPTGDTRIFLCGTKYDNRHLCEYYEEDKEYHRCTYYRNDGYYPANFCVYNKENEVENINNGHKQ
jgi:hypothetical protein